ncbi:hypothetical protein K8R42_02395, partial [bacterium]|nr:hypothetical protein [bacterium]
MESIQWRYEPTAEQRRKAKLVPRLLSFSFHFSGVIYALVYYFGDQPKNFAIILSILYVVGLLFWHLKLKHDMVLSSEVVDINNQRIKIFEVDKNKTKRYKWEDFKSFSENINTYFDKNTPNISLRDISPDKYFYLGRSKTDHISLRVPAKYIDRVQVVLR